MVSILIISRCLNKKLIDYILETNANLFMVSNNLKSTVFSGLRQFKITQYFDMIIGVDEAGFPKPCTIAWDILLKSRDINHKSCLFIGDSQLTDKKFAQRVGISFLNVNDLVGTNNE